MVIETYFYWVDEKNEETGTLLVKRRKKDFEEDNIIEVVNLDNKLPLHFLTSLMKQICRGYDVSGNKFSKIVKKINKDGCIEYRVMELKRGRGKITRIGSKIICKNGKIEDFKACSKHLHILLDFINKDVEYLNKFSSRESKMQLSER